MMVTLGGVRSPVVPMSSSAVAGSSGSITFSTLSNGRATGSFTFTLQPANASANGTRTVAGSFDLAFAN